MAFRQWNSRMDKIASKSFIQAFQAVADGSDCLLQTVVEGRECSARSHAQPKICCQGSFVWSGHCAELLHIIDDANSSDFLISCRLAYWYGWALGAGPVSLKVGCWNILCKQTSSDQSNEKTSLLKFDLIHFQVGRFGQFFESAFRFANL